MFLWSISTKYGIYNIPVFCAKVNVQLAASSHKKLVGLMDNYLQKKFSRFAYV
jgi:hypothetical protein